VRDAGRGERYGQLGDPETAVVLREHRVRSERRAVAIGGQLDLACYVFSGDPDSRTPLNPEAVTQRYKRMAARLGVDTTLKSLRHYSATELVSGGIDVRTVAGRLGHGGGGATTLRVYTAWTSEADQRASRTVSGRMPVRPAHGAQPGPDESPGTFGRPADDNSPYRKIAADLRGAIESGILQPGDPLSTEKALADRYGVAVSTAHRAVSELVIRGLATASRGKRAVVT
jgi:integrase